MPRRALEAGVAALGTRLVVAGGYDASAAGLDISVRVDAFDTAIGAWAALPDAPVRRTGPSLAAVGATLYLAGGFEGGLAGAPLIARGDAFALDAITARWQPIATIDPSDERGAAGVVGAQGRLYLLGGASSTGPLASCLEYDVAQDRWSHLPDLPAPRAHPAAMRLVDGTLIVAGGFESLDASQPRGDVWALPPAGGGTRAWQPRAAMHPPGDRDARGGCAYGVVLGELVCAGGEGGQLARTAVESFAPYADTWTVREAMPVARAGVQGAAIGGQLYVPGGAAALTLDPTDTLYIYTPLDAVPR
jgi:N-acetylneuraminic acid mutarotase